MRSGTRTFIKGLMAMTGTTIGAGIFGLPLAFSQVGFWPGTILFFFLAAAVCLSHVLYTAVVLRLGAKQRLAGYAKQTFGEVGFAVASVTYPLHIIGSNVAYIILGGEFLAAIAYVLGFDLPVSTWQVVFWVIGMAIVLYGLKFLATFEAYATVALLLAVAAAAALVWPQADLTTVMRLGNWGAFVIPFGVFLFSLSGLSVISEVVDITKHKPSDAYAAVLFGTLIAAAFSYVFAVSLYLAARGMPLRNPADLVSLLPSAWALIIPVMGLLAIITSYITSAQDLRVAFVRDFKLGEVAGAVVAMVAPFVIFTLITRDFLSVISFVGAVFIGINYCIACLIGWKLASRARILMKRVIYSATSVLLMSVYAFGIIQKLFSRSSL